MREVKVRGNLKAKEDERGRKETDSKGRERGVGESRDGRYCWQMED
jgi:hypothetical protein